MKIHDEAVKVVAGHLSLMMVDPDGDYVVEARDLLEAASQFMAPTIKPSDIYHIKATALREAFHEFPLEAITAPDNAVVWLMRRAEQIEGEL